MANYAIRKSGKRNIGSTGNGDGSNRVDDTAPSRSDPGPGSGSGYDIPSDIGLDTIDPGDFAGGEFAATSDGGGNGGPADNETGGEDGAPRKRGRPKGSKNGTAGSVSAKAASSSHLKKEHIAPYIMMAHMFLARSMPEFTITPEEADHLAGAMANYARHSNININPKSRDLAALLIAIGMVEGTRVLAVMQRKKTEKMDRQRPPSYANVAPISGAYGMPSG